jgi:hypothetical protein
MTLATAFGRLEWNMIERLAAVGLQYSVYALEVGLVAYLALRGHFRRLLGLSLYVAGLLLIDVVGRPLVLYRYGLTSREYAYTYWLSDALLALTAFALICALFYRACADEPKIWHVARLVLAFAFILVLGVSLLSLSSHFDELVTRFVVEFEQNLYFTCLVLNTLLFLLLQQTNSADEELRLLVCGMGIQFAGPAASYALVHLTPGQSYAIELNSFLVPVFTMGMLLIWFYAVARKPQHATEAAAPNVSVQGMVKVHAHEM